ncbi:DUF554 domain-containing protein [Paludibacter sp. 221]|uniref:DUF554 domain-containing protein n=1 Tax=Paludibacter sp. 221 TaxID=2302939 RepID=UPI0013D33134|nr:DUF554 domain-containing protein [Paludibacter sp. 221]NDV46534.1 DUF554 domain-containing protein [Paludibacter sp. 221]
MLGTIVNTAAVIVGGSLGLLFKKNMPQRITNIYFQAVGLFTLAIGISMVWNMENILIVVASLVVGSMIGEWIDIEAGAEKLSEWLKKKFRIGNERFSEGLITSFLLFCMGSMTILGAINEGLDGNSDLLMTKSLMDGFSSLLLASALGIGVVFSALPMFIFQGGITLLAMWASTFFTPDIINGITAIGGIMLIGLGINLLDIKKLRIMNMLPSLLIVVLLLWIFV